MVKFEGSLVGLDTNIFIYHFVNNLEYDPFCSPIFKGLSNNQLKAVTSLITLVELLSLRGTQNEINQLHYKFFRTPNLSVSNVELEIAVEAARIRRIYGFRVPDSIQLATALFKQVDSFVTNDSKLTSFKEVQVITLKDLTNIP